MEKIHFLVEINPQIPPALTNLIPRLIVVAYFWMSKVVSKQTQPSR
jgi:hypothetical protein